MRENNEGTHRYDDIIDLPHHVSGTHPQMSMSERAAQFSPFAALTGHKDAVKETARLTDEWVDLDENSREDLDRKMGLLKEHLKEYPEVDITYFQPDTKKTGGAYRLVSGTIKKIDMYEHTIVMEDGEILPMEYIIEIDSILFEAAGTL